MMDKDYKDSVKFLASALLRLQEVLQEDISVHSSFVDATIQRFDFSIELFWKALKKKLFHDYSIDAQSPKTVLQQAYINRLITNEKIWLDMIKDRNLTSHTYNQELALEIYHRIQKYGPFLEQEFNRVFKS